MAHIVSRSSVTFLRRRGILPTPRYTQPPRLDTRHLRAHDEPLTRNQLDPALLLDADGSPPPDRGLADLWPPPQEVQIDGTQSA